MEFCDGPNSIKLIVANYRVVENRAPAPLAAPREQAPEFRPRVSALAVIDMRHFLGSTRQPTCIKT